VSPSPEVAGEQDDDGEQFQSSDDHQGAKIDLQAWVEEGEVAHGCSVSEGRACVGEHAEG